MRGDTLVLVTNTILCFHGANLSTNVNTALAIAGYTTGNNKIIVHINDRAIRSRPINMPPLNIETIFARAMVVADKIYSKRNKVQKMKRYGPKKITNNEAMSWRDDEHLGMYTVASIFPARMDTDKTVEL